MVSIIIGLVPLYPNGIAVDVKLRLILGKNGDNGHILK